ncbi:MAG: AMP-binding protein [Gammaproteobacteria bacterium]
MQPAESRIKNSFARYVQETPAAPALWVQGVSYSYRELSVVVDRLRVALRQQKALAMGAPVAVFAARSLTAYAAVLACAAEGLTWVPLNPAFPRDAGSAYVAVVRRTGGNCG